MNVDEAFLSKNVGLIHTDNKWHVGLSPNDEILNSKIISIRFKKDDSGEMVDPYELTICLDNGSEIEIYFDREGRINICSD